MLSGTANLDELVVDRAKLESFGTESVALPHVEILQAMFEIRVTGRQCSLPSGLHPTNPPALVLLVWSCPDSPWGPFRMAQARIECRSGLRARGFVQGCVVDNPSAIDALRSRWGFPAQQGEVLLQRGYDIVTASVAIAGSTLVALDGMDPDPLGRDDVAYSTTVSLADTPRGPRLVQIDTEVAAARAERLRPRLDAFAPSGWVHSSVEPYYPMSASIAIADVTIQRLRYVSKPEEPAFSGTEPVGEST